MGKFEVVIDLKFLRENPEIVRESQRTREKIQDWSMLCSKPTRPDALPF